MLPDWAVVDVTKPHYTGVSSAGFFDERWRLVESPK